MSSLDCGGVENLLYNYYTNIKNEEIVFDFIVHGKKSGFLESKFEKLGSKIYHVTPKKKSIIKNIFEVKKIIKNGRYDIVHCHQNFSSFTSLFLAFIHNVPIRIIHAHGYKKINTKKEKIKTILLRFINSLFSNYYFACSNDAGNWLYGKKWKSNNHYFLMKNAINTKKFKFDNNIRLKYRKEFNIENDCKILIHIGRFSQEKNHQFLLEIISKIENAKLFLIGNGDLEKEIKNKVKIRNITEKVYFLGNREDVNNLLFMADIFLFPSKNEGFGLCALESQCAGLKTIISENIPREIILTDLVNVVSIDSLNEWIECINKETKEYNRKHYFEIINSSCYNIEKATKEYINYIKSIKGK